MIDGFLTALARRRSRRIDPQPGLAAIGVPFCIGVVVIALAVALILLSACGGVLSLHKYQVTPSASPPRPHGSPPPAQLQGKWTESVGPRPGWPMILTASGYVMQRPGLGPGEESAIHGEVVVDGDEIDFFNADDCTVVPPGDVGRYRWTLTDKSLQIVPLLPDPCFGRRYELGEGATFTRAGASG